jgi:predicted esterase
MLFARFAANVTILCALSTLTACGSDAGNGGTDPTGTGGAGGAGDAGGDTSGSTPTLPTTTATCPEFHEGMATMMSAGIMRSFQIYIDDAAAAAKDGPFVMYWYGTGGTPPQAVQGLSTEGLQRIKDAGGVVVAPVHVSTGSFPWISDDDVNVDFTLMDDLIACAKAKVGIDARHVHMLGFSAGALFTAQTSFKRASYLASVATYSGGGMGMFDPPDGKFAAMIFYGGPNDVVLVKFQEASQQYYDALTGAGHFAFQCNHNGGHMIPPVGQNVVQFFFDHPFGTDPSPYKAAGLPTGFPSYCVL